MLSNKQKRTTGPLHITEHAKVMNEFQTVFGTKFPSSDIFLPGANLPVAKLPIAPGKNFHLIGFIKNIYIQLTASGARLIIFLTNSRFPVTAVINNYLIYQSLLLIYIAQNGE